MRGNRALERIEQAAVDTIRLCHCDLLRAETNGVCEYLARHGITSLPGDPVDLIYSCFMCDREIAWDVRLFPEADRARMARFLELFRQHWLTPSLSESKELFEEAEWIANELSVIQEQVCSEAFGPDLYDAALKYGAECAAKIEPYVDRSIQEWKRNRQN